MNQANVSGGHGVTFSNLDRRFMLRALTLAKRGQGYVEPNPMVGCVLVRGRRIVGEGYHRRFGGPHAEVDALSRARAGARGATAYVTLEPCGHFGKTPPCTRSLIDGGIRRVVAPAEDPGPWVAGRGFRQLRSAGIRVDVGLCQPEAELLNRPYFKMLRTGMPYVITKWAQSLDGKIATRRGDSQWISGDGARRLVHRLRARMDAVIVGIGTVLADDPRLTARDTRVRRVAARLVLDTHLRTPPTASLFTAPFRGPVEIVTIRSRVQRHALRARRLIAAGADITTVRPAGSRPSLPALLRLLGRRGYSNVLVEGGEALTSALLDANLVDEVLAFVSPRLIGGRDAVHAFAGLGSTTLSTAPTWPNVEVRRVGSDWLFRLRR